MKTVTEKMKRLTILLLWAVSLLFAETNGKITGRVIDSDNGEPLLGANVIVEGLGIGAASDMDGFYMINNVPPGNHTILVSYIGYQTRRISDLQVIEGKTIRLDISLRRATLQMGSVVVESEASRTSDAYLLSKQKNSVNIQDGISAAGISKSGDSNAAEAVKRISGVTVMDGKFVYVRGLGERYTMTQVNGGPIPSPEPEKKTVPLNLFPAAILEGITVLKTFTPDLPGVFAGGNVNIRTKAYPDERVMNISISASKKTYPQNNQVFLISDGGKWDFFGYDDGTRAMPSSIPDTIRLSEWNTKLSPNPTERKLILGNIGRDFKTGFAMRRARASFPLSLGLNYGNRYTPSENFEWGFYTNASFSNDYTYRESDVHKYSVSSSGLYSRVGVINKKSEYATNFGGTFSTGMKLYNRHKLKLHYIYTHSSQDWINVGQGYADNFDDGVFIKQYYSEKSIKDLTLGGTHQFDFLAEHKIEWSLSTGKSRLYEPDYKGLNYRRKTGISDGEETSYFQMDTYYWSSGTRDFTDGFDKNRNMDLTYQLNFTDKTGENYKLKLGTRIQDKSRDFARRSFYHKYGTQYGSSVIPPEISVVYDENDFGKSLNDSNYFTVDENGNAVPGLLIVEGTSPGDAYHSEERIRASYFMVDVPLSFGVYNPLRNVRFIGGIRREGYSLLLNPYDPITHEPFVSPITGDTVKADINEVNLLPSCNLLINFPGDVNLRLSYSRTVARAEFREIAPFEFQAFYGGEIVVGYPYLKTTDIRNYDLRIEWYRRAGELLALSFFKKDFFNPIEVALIEASGKLYKTFQNALYAKSSGVELDSRTRLDFLPIKSGNLSLIVNATLTKSEVSVDSTITIFTGYTVENEATSLRRPLQGQSDLVVNVGIYYDSYSGFHASLTYNTFSKRLVSLGVGDLPDEYELPFHSVNLVISKKFGRVKAQIKIKNLLNSRVQFGQTDPISGEFNSTEVYMPGRSVSVGLSYDL